MNAANKWKVVVLVMFLSLVNLSGVVNGAEKQVHLQEVGQGIVQEVKSGKMWITEKTPRFDTVSDVQGYLKTLNSGVYSDWRLPTKWEMAEFYDIFDLKKAGDIKLQLEGNYWMIVDSGEPSAAAWEIGDQCDPERFFYTKTSGRVRAIRP